MFTDHIGSKVWGSQHEARFLNNVENTKIVPGSFTRERGPRDIEFGAGLFGEFRAFVQLRLARITAVSVLVLVPCFWHRTIVAADLGSHVYNAWLAQLIRHGQVPGLWLAPRWNNVLFDYLLGFCARFVAIPTAEKIVVSLLILIFFWGAFAFVSAATRRAPWFLVPCLAMVSYGFTFEMGFSNYYLSLGLAFWGVAIFWRGKGRERAVPLVLAPFIILANPLGLVWMAAASAYIFVVERLRAGYQWMLVPGAIAILGVAHWHFWHANVIEEQRKAAYYFNGTDQFLLFGARYWIPQLLFGIFAVAAVGYDLYSRRAGKLGFAPYNIPVQFYVVLIFAAGLLPEGIRFANQPVALAILTERLSSVTAVVLCCILGAMIPRKWHLIAFGATAAVFFTFLFQDTGKIDRMEARLEKLVRTIAANQRVMGTIRPFDDSRILIQHMLERACIGYCFSYGNYEAASQQFRVRANEGNPYLMTYFGDTSDMEDGTYEVQAEDLPAFQVYQCNADGTQLCIAPLRAGQMNDELGVHPD